MDSSAPFCTCTDLKCSCNPKNHTQGCNPCVAKCLGKGEVPSCFYHRVGPTDADTVYSFRGFADFVEKHQGAKV